MFRGDGSNFPQWIDGAGINGSCGCYHHSGNSTSRIEFHRVRQIIRNHVKEVVYPNGSDVSMPDAEQRYGFANGHMYFRGSVHGIGARQTGKSTLVQDLTPRERRFLSLDDLDVADLARSDPEALVGGSTPIVLDEIQREPNLLATVKRAIDRDRRRGQFVLTGSANLLLMQGVSESLARASELFNTVADDPKGTDGPGTLWAMGEAAIGGGSEMAGSPPLRAEVPRRLACASETRWVPNTGGPHENAVGAGRVVRGLYTNLSGTRPPNTLGHLGVARFPTADACGMPPARPNRQSNRAFT